MTNFKEFMINLLAPWIPSEFLRGAAMALIAVLILIVLFWIISLLIYLRNGKHRCNQITVSQGNGNIVVSGVALTEAIRGELQEYNQLQIRKINLFRRRKDYIVEICCAFHVSADAGSLPELTAVVKPRLTEKAKTLFGIENLTAIHFTVVDFQSGDAANR